MNISMRQFRAFSAVAALGNFTKAADRLHMTQAGLSLSLRDMETQLGFRLFDRTTRAVWLTEAGRQLLPSVERALAEIEGSAESIAKQARAGGRRLVVAASPLVCASVLPALSRRFEQLHPEFDVVLQDVERSQIQAMVESGQADLGLGLLFKPAAGVRRQALFRVPLVLVGPPATPSTEPRPRIAWRGLAGRPLLVLPNGNAMQQYIDERLAEAGCRDNRRRVYFQLATLIAMAEAGYGSAVLPSFVQGACARHQVTVQRLPAADALDFYAITQNGRQLPEAMRVFLALLAETMSPPGRTRYSGSNPSPRSRPHG